MKINSVRIHNFRSVLDGNFFLKDYSLLIGPNNSGKSNIVDALRVFYEHKGEKFINERDIPKSPTADGESWIEIEYQLSKEEADTLKHEYLQPENRLIIRKHLRGPARPAGLYAYVNDKLSESLFYGTKNVQQAKLGEVIYIPAVSKLDDETKFSGPSPLRELVNEILKKVIQSSPAYQTLNNQFQAFSTAFKEEKTADTRSLQDLETEINHEISEWGVEFDLEFNAIDETNLLKNLVDFKINDLALSDKTDAQRQGQGFQRHLIFTLIRLSARYQPSSSQAAKKDFSPEFTILLFEEPEAYLHPAQQDALCASLKSLSQQPNYEVLVSSHSPHFVSHNTLDISSIIRLRRNGAWTEVGQIPKNKLFEIFRDNQEINELLAETCDRATADDLKLDMEALKYFIWLNPERCGMFFAKHVILVEGATERALFNYLFDTYRIPRPCNGLFILDSMGKHNFHRFMNILGELRIPHSLLFDGDMQRGYNPKIRALIERSKNNYTVRIHEFPDDIEDFLGIDKCKNPHRKPQHVLLKFHETAISGEKIEELGKLLQDLVSNNAVIENGTCEELARI